MECVRLILYGGRRSDWRFAFGIHGDGDGSRSGGDGGCPHGLRRDQYELRRSRRIV